MRYSIGYSWPGESGDRTITDVGQHPHTGQPAYAVSTPGQHFPSIVTEDQIDAEIALDVKLSEQAIRNRLRDEERERVARESSIRQLEHDSWFGFTDNLQPLQQSRVRAILNKHMTLNHGSIEERGTVIAFLVSQGSRVQKQPGGSRRLVSDDGHYLSEKDVTKIGMDFAEFLLRSEKR
jgi:hypothetical protein